MSERFTFIICGDTGYVVEEKFTTRKRADDYFDVLCASAKEDRTHAISYYGTEIGGLVNSWHE